MSLPDSHPSNRRSRFVITTIEGSRPKDRRRVEEVDWMVLDRAYCHQVVETFRGRNNMRRALELAARLNLEHGPWPA